MKKKYVPAPPMTYAELAAKLATFTPEQLAMPVRWWGEERAGEIARVDILREEYIDAGYGAAPASTYADDPPEESQIEARYPAGTPMLASDVEVEAPDGKAP